MRKRSGRYSRSNRSLRSSLTSSESASGLGSPRSGWELLTSGGQSGSTYVPPQSLGKAQRTGSKTPAPNGSESKRSRSKPENELAESLRLANLGWFVEEHRFHPTRKWRFDFAFLAQRLAVEVEGGVWAGGRHTRGSGFLGDCEKYNEATRLGWRVLRFVPRKGWAQPAVQLITEMLAS